MDFTLSHCPQIIGGYFMVIKKIMQNVGFAKVV